MSYVKNNFAKLLDEHEKATGLTDNTLAERISVSKMTIYYWRTGKTKRPLSRDKLLKCAEILELTPIQCAEFLQAAGHCSPTCQPPPVPVVGIPIMQPYHFFGRESILQQIYWAWHKTVPESIAIIGPKRSGKTSLLNYLYNIAHTTCLRPKQPQGWPDNWLPRGFNYVWMDFQDANMSRIDTLLKDVLQQLKLEVPSSCDLASFSRIIKQQVKPTTVILMDNLEAGFRTASFEVAFWENMRFLGSHGKLSFVVTALEPPAQLEQSSVFFSIFGHILALGALTESEARELLTSFSQTFSPTEIEFMLKESGCWPEPLQKLCDTRLQQLM